MKDYISLVNQIATDKNVKLLDSNDKDSILIKKIKEKGNEKTEDIIKQLSNTLRSEIERFTEEIINLNVTRQGIVIKGKPNNIAFSSYGAKALMCCNGNLTMAGRLSAFQFSDDFRKLNHINGIQEIPIDECKFMKEYSDFDSISAWYKGDFEITESGTQNDPYISIVVTEPFIASPNTNLFYIDYSRSKYLEGYYISLFNSCSDYLRIVSNAQRRKYKYKYAVSIENTKETRPDKIFYQIKYKTQHISEWESINALIYYIVDQLNDSGMNKTDVIEIITAFKDMQQLLMANFNFDINNLQMILFGNKPMSELLQKIQVVPENIEINRYVFHCLLNEVRVKYEDLRIDKLTK